MVKNLSHRLLTQDEEQVLALGLNFAVTPKTVPTEKIIAATKATAKQMRPDKAEKLRTIVSNVLRTTPRPRSNLPSHLQRAITGLRDDDTIPILLADKGNVTVVMDRKEYKKNIESILVEKTYKKPRRDPTQSIERKIGQALKENVIVFQCGVLDFLSEVG